MVSDRGAHTTVSSTPLGRISNKIRNARIPWSSHGELQPRGARGRTEISVVLTVARLSHTAIEDACLKIELWGTQPCQPTVPASIGVSVAKTAHAASPENASPSCAAPAPPTHVPRCTRQRRRYGSSPLEACCRASCGWCWIPQTEYPHAQGSDGPGHPAGGLGSAGIA